MKYAYTYVVIGLVVLLAFSTAKSQPIISAPLASNETDVSAQVSATINRNSTAITIATIVFEYSRNATMSTGISQVTATPSNIAADGDYSVSASLNGLDPTTTYYFRVSITYSNGGGLSNVLRSSISNFTTRNNRPLLSTATASSITSTTAALSGLINAQGISRTQARFRYWQGTDSAGTVRTTPYQSIVTDNMERTIVANITNLSANTQYNFTLEAINSFNLVSPGFQGAEVSFTTRILPPVVTLNPINQLTISHDTVVVSAVLTSSGETNYKFVLSTVSDFLSTFTTTQTVINSPASQTINATVSNLQPSTTYYYYFEAQNTSGTTQTAQQNFTTLSRPPEVATATAIVFGYDRASLNGSINTHGMAARVFFEVQNGNVTVTTTTKTINSNTWVAVVDTVVGLTANTSYTYRLVAESQGRRVQGSDETFTTLNAAPSVVLNRAQDVTSDSASLSASVTTNMLLTRAVFEYSTDPNFNNFLTSSPVENANNFNMVSRISRLSASTTYYVRVRAESASGEVLSVTSAFTTRSPPPEIIGFSLVENNESIVVFSGTVNPNGQPTNVWFEYWQRGQQNATVLNTSAKSIGSGSTPVTFTDTLRGLQSSTVYEFRLRAGSGLRESFSDTADFYTADKIPFVRFAPNSVSTLTSSSVGVQGYVNANGLNTQWYFEFSFSADFSSAFKSHITTISNSRTEQLVSSTLNGLAPRTTVFYRLVAINQKGSAATSILQATTSFGPPTVILKNAEDVTATSANLKVDINPGGLQTDLVFHVSQSPDFRGQLWVTDNINVGAGTSSIEINRVFAGLTSNRVYYFRAVAVRTDAQQYPSDDVNQFQTLIAPPTVKLTLPVQQPRYDTAIFASTISANESKTTYYFEYSTSQDFSANVVQLPSDTTKLHSQISSTETIQIKAAPLKGFTTYYFRLVAVNNGGKTVSDVASFSTPLGPPSVTLNDASNVLSTSVVLSGKVIPNFNDPTDAWFEYWKTSEPNGKKLTIKKYIGKGEVEDSVGTTLENLEPSTDYSFRLVANQTISEVKTFETRGLNPVISRFGIDNITNHSVKVTVQGMSTSLPPDGTVRINYKRKDSPDGANFLQESFSTSAFSFERLIQDLESSTEYIVNIQVENRWGSIEGDSLSFVTLPATEISSINSKDITATSARLSASVASGGWSTSVHLEYSVFENFSRSSLVQNIDVVQPAENQREVFYTLENLNSVETYYFRFIAQNQKGRALSSTSSFKTLTPEPEPRILISSGITFPKRTNQRDYQTSDWKLIGLPGEKDVEVIKALNLDINKQGTEWEVYAFNPSDPDQLKKYDSENELFSLAKPGKGFWLISKSDVVVNHVAFTPTMNSIEEVEVRVEKGWNIITNPFNSPILWSFIQKSNDMQSVIYDFSQKGYSIADTLKPMKGYFYYAEEVHNLKIPYASVFETKSEASKLMASTEILKGNYVWALNAILQSKSGRDEFLTIGIAKDDLRLRKPNAPTGATTLSIQNGKDSYGIDMKKNVGIFEPMRWTINAQTKPNQTASISFENIYGKIPENLVIGIYDVFKDTYKILKKDESYDFVSKGKNKFLLTIGEESEVLMDFSRKNDIAMSEAKFSLNQNYPNPFSFETTIVYSLEKETYITLKVYDILGREIALLEQGKKSPGKHLVSFPANDLPNGRYFYSLSSTSQKTIKSMMVVK